MGERRQVSRPRRHVLMRRSRPGGRLVLAVAGVVALGVLAQAQGWIPRDLGGVLRPRAFVEVDGRSVAVPRPSPAAGRVLPAVAVTTHGAHAFLHTTPGGGPVGYDPCRPVRWVLRPDGAPPEGERLVADAVAIVQEATGLSFEPAGATDEPPALDRPLVQPDRYGEGWAPVLVAWSTAAQVPELEGQVAGVGGSAAVPGADGEGTWLAAGRLVLDSEDLRTLLDAPDGYERARAVLVHELGHVVGLDHVGDADELMNPTTSGRTDLGPGDREGFALVGQVPCER